MSYAAIADYLRAKERDQRAALVADWRRRHPAATCSDHVAGMLADLEAACAPGATARRG